MRQFSKLGRTGVAVAMFGAILALPPIAHGAMGTSTTLITTARPDLVSVTTPGSQGGPTADFCFSRASGLRARRHPGLFQLNGYHDNTSLIADSIAQINNFCIEATFTNPEPRTTWSSTPTATSGRVPWRPTRAAARTSTDSTPLNGSDTNNGTRGLQYRPDLQQVVVRGSQNQIDYLFDQEVIGDSASSGALNPTGFKYIDQAGEDHFSTDATVETASDGRERVVRAQFDDSIVGMDDVTDAVIAVAEPGAVSLRSCSGDIGDDQADNDRFAVTVPGTSGDTNDPDLVSTELVAGGDSDLMLFTYNGQIDPGSDTQCYAIFSTSHAPGRR